MVDGDTTSEKPKKGKSNMKQTKSESSNAVTLHLWALLKEWVCFVNKCYTMCLVITLKETGSIFQSDLDTYWMELTGEVTCRARKPFRTGPFPGNEPGVIYKHEPDQPRAGILNPREEVGALPGWLTCAWFMWFVSYPYIRCVTWLRIRGKRSPWLVSWPPCKYLKPYS